MLSNRAGLVVALAVVVLAGLSSTGAASAAVALGLAVPTSSSLNVTAHFGGWTWFGTGEPCDPTANLTYVAHFFSNATGGVPPYLFAWNFGDGANSSSAQNATHVFRNFQGFRVVDLNVSDSAGDRGNVSLQVPPLIFACPSEPAPGPAPLPPALPTGPESPLPILAASIVIGIAVVGCVVAWREGRRLPP